MDYIQPKTVELKEAPWYKTTTKEHGYTASVTQLRTTGHGPNNSPITDINSPTGQHTKESNMNTHVIIELEGKAKAVKGTTSKVTALKTKTKLEIHFDKDSYGGMDILGELTEDVAMLGLQGAPVMCIGLTVEGVGAIGRLINRSCSAMARVGVLMTELDWEADSGAVTVVEGEGLPLTGHDVAILVWTLAKVIMRALAPVGGTHHPLSLYDLKQITGAVYDAKGGDEQAVAVLDWFDVRELTVLETEKAAKAEARAAVRAEKKAAKAEAQAQAKADKAEAKTKPAGKEKNGGKAKAKKTAKAKTASLAHMTED